MLGWVVDVEVVLGVCDCDWGEGRSIHTHGTEPTTNQQQQTKLTWCGHAPVDAGDGQGEARVAPDQRLRVEEHRHALIVVGGCRMCEG